MAPACMDHTVRVNRTLRTCVSEIRIITVIEIEIEIEIGDMIESETEKDEIEIATGIARVALTDPVMSGVALLVGHGTIMKMISKVMMEEHLVARGGDHAIGTEKEATNTAAVADTVVAALLDTTEIDRAVEIQEVLNHTHSSSIAIHM